MLSFEGFLAATTPQIAAPQRKEGGRQRNLLYHRRDPKTLEASGPILLSPLSVCCNNNNGRLHKKKERIHCEYVEYVRIAQMHVSLCVCTRACMCIHVAEYDRVSESVQCKRDL